MKTTCLRFTAPNPVVRHTALFILIAALLMAGLTSLAFAQTGPRVWLETTHGPIVLELDSEKAPITTENFLNYVNEGFYDGLIFHRVIAGFVIQAGGFDRNLNFISPTQATIKSEAGNGLSNEPYSIAMGLVGGDVDSAQAQFYINAGDNNFLDDDYTVFGEVVAGQATVDRINQLITVGLQNIGDGVPLELPAILWAKQTSQFPLMPLHTGSWYNEATSGTGFNIEITHDASTESGPLAIVYWYDFDQGQQIWLTGVKAFEWGDHRVKIDLVTANYPIAGADFRQPPVNSEFESWGTLEIEFSSCARGQVRFDSPQRGQSVIDVVRLSLPVGAGCDTL
ncbi:MAG TPA: peptidylprolyl isomerase [Wenzhouxiangella sp.]